MKEQKIGEMLRPKLLNILLLFAFLLSGEVVFAQSKEVKGVVKDPTGETVIGASVLEKEPLMVLLQILMEILC